MKIIKLERPNGLKAKHLAVLPDFSAFAKQAKKGYIIEVYSERDLDSLYHAMKRIGLRVSIGTVADNRWVVGIRKLEPLIAKMRRPNLRRLGKGAKKKVASHKS